MTWPTFRSFLSMLVVCLSVASYGISATAAEARPADSTEDDYFQACRAAKAWMEQQGGDPKAQIEPYLKMVQSAEFVGPGTFHVPWSQLSPGQQSAVIVAVQAGADALCG